MILPEQTLAWCAGVVDVMGLIKVRRMDTGALLPAVHMSSANQEILAQLSALTGTTVTQVFRDYNRMGCGEHCTEPHQHVLSSTGRWSLTGARATIFLAAVAPYLKVKKQEVEDALAHGMVAPFKDATLKKMYALGWPELS